MKSCRPAIVIPALLVLGGCGDGAASREPAPLEQRTPRRVVAAELRVDASTATPVISSAQKFIIPVPALAGGGEPLRYPDGHENAGAPIMDFEGKPVAERGLVFFNDKDKTVQAVAGDGEGVVIINEVTLEHAAEIERKIAEFSKDPEALTVGQLRQVLEFARADLKLGDMYNSTRAFVRGRMTPVMTDQTRETPASTDYGLKKRDDRDICYAVYVPGSFVFEGPAATPQVFENGGVIVAQGVELRGVQPDIFVRTYRLADGRGIERVTNDLRVVDVSTTPSK